MCTRAPSSDASRSDASAHRVLFALALPLRLCLRRGAKRATGRAPYAHDY